MTRISRRNGPLCPRGGQPVGKEGGGPITEQQVTLVRLEAGEEDAGRSLFYQPLIRQVEVFRYLSNS